MRKFNKLSKHRTSMFRTMSNQLIEHGQIETTLEKAKELRSIIEKLITKAKMVHLNKEKELQIRRLLLSRLNNNKKNTDILMNNIGVRFKDRKGGYTKIKRNGFRHGDKGNKAYIQIINE
jgi:large subunit ribosomal protein L17